MLVPFHILKLNATWKDCICILTKTHLRSASPLGPGWGRGTLYGPLVPAAAATPAASPGPPLRPASSSLRRPWRSPAASPRGGPAFPAVLSRPQPGPLPRESRSVGVTEAELSGYTLGTLRGWIAPQISRTGPAAPVISMVIRLLPCSFKGSTDLPSHPLTGTGWNTLKACCLWPCHPE